MESFKYFLNIDITKLLLEEENNININLLKKQNFESLFFFENNDYYNTDKKKIIIKKNIGKLIGFGGLTISKLRKDNKDITIKINGSNNEYYNREVIFIGPIEKINNIICEIKKIIGDDNIIE